MTLLDQLRALKCVEAVELEMITGPTRGSILLGVTVFLKDGYTQHGKSFEAGSIEEAYRVANDTIWS